MSRRAAHSDAEAPGQDSFLDVVANLVGIILILIMVVGSQTRQAFIQALQNEKPTASEVVPPQPSALEREVAAATAAAATVEKDFQSLTAKIERQKFEVKYRKAERDRLQQLLTAAQAQLDQNKSQLSAEQRAEYEGFGALNAARRELRDLKLAKDAALNSEATPGIIEHLPTPLAKTVFGKELHLRLDRGKVCYVPLNELVEKLKDDAPRNVWKLKDASEVTEVIGPLEGFRMKYTLHKVDKAVQAGQLVGKASYVELKRFILVPVTDDLGEPLAEALAPQSQLRSLLKEYPADRTTVTVWVYPESFDHFRQLKAALFSLGYATAGRPLPAHHPIGGSPDGSHSSAQ